MIYGIIKKGLDMKKIITTCALDCPDNCGMIADVEDGRLVGLRGNPDHGHTKGYLCKKGYRYSQRIYSGNRVFHPLKKKGGEWHKIGWDEALDTIAEKMRFFKDIYGETARSCIISAHRPGAPRNTWSSDSSISSAT